LKEQEEARREREQQTTLEFFQIEFGILGAVAIAAAVFFFGFNQVSENVYTGRSSGSTFTRGELVFEQWYQKATEASKKATSLAIQKAEKTLGEVNKPNMGPSRVSQSLVDRVRSIAFTLDVFQQDIYDDLWVALGTYPSILSGYVPVLEYYTDEAYPKDNADPVLQSTRASLKFEVSRFRRAADELKPVVESRNIRDTERLFAELSISYDRFLKAGSLYAGYDPVTSTTVFYENIADSQLVYTPLSLEQPRIRDEVLVLQGPDKGKVGQVIWLGKSGPGNPDPDKIITAVVKLTSNPVLGGNTGKGVKEVKAYPYSWIAVTRTSQQSFALDVLLGGLSAVFSCGLTYPLDSIKARIQAGLSPMPREGPLTLFSGLTFNLWREVPNQALYLAGFNYLTRFFCTLPSVNANDPNLKLLVMIPAGVLGCLSGSFFRAPFEVLNRQLQTGLATTNEEAVNNVFNKPPPERVVQNMYAAWVLTVFKSIPFGALQCTFYELFKDRLELIDFGVAYWVQPFVWGGLAGYLTGVLTNPPDRVLGVVADLQQTQEAEKLELVQAANNNGKPADAHSDKLLVEARADEKSVFDQIGEAIDKINREEGWQGYFKGAQARAFYFAPEACLWFAAYEYLRGVADVFSEF
jgi:hypothetical protein